MQPDDKVRRAFAPGVEVWVSPRRAKWMDAGMYGVGLSLLPLYCLLYGWILGSLGFLLLLLAFVWCHLKWSRK